MNRAVFLDRDGVLIEDRNYLRAIEEVQFIPGVGLALRRLLDRGFFLFLVTNQSGVGRGYFTMTEVERVHDFITATLGKNGVQFHKIYVAPEAPEQPSLGRKPSPYFLFAARDAYQIAMEKSYMVGDKLIDLQCGWNAGVRRSILVRTGYGRGVEAASTPELERAVIVDDVTAAARWIEADMETEGPAQSIAPPKLFE